MTAQYWTITGYDIWRLNKREVFDFKNLNTGELVTCRDLTDVMEQKFLPVKMPEPKETKSKKQTVKKPKDKTAAKSEFKGVSASGTPGKWRAMAWDKKQKKLIHLGTFDSELLAAAAYQDYSGNKKEAMRLRNEYEEGNCRPETPVEHKAIFPSEQ